MKNIYVMTASNGHCSDCVEAENLYSAIEKAKQAMLEHMAYLFESCLVVETLPVFFYLQEINDDLEFIGPRVSLGV